ncbi:MAG TPA: hypothetical protein VGB85_12985, partial [Nannocystis sp.]
TFAGSVPAIVAQSAYTFAGPQATVTTTALQRLTGAATTSLGAAANIPNVRVDLCYQPNGGGVLTNFSGFAYVEHPFTVARVPYTAVGSVVPGAGTWKVGLCVYNPTATSINQTNYMNGWVQVTN